MENLQTHANLMFNQNNFHNFNNNIHTNDEAVECCSWSGGVSDDDNNPKQLHIDVGGIMCQRL